ncbi:glycosyltransferase [Halovenus sp. WSH3]|uniref:Glycosyltransferase n=1 Tax=Halovenus carboxidivorans TaxID=2692199 RepID=A0A6B0T1Y1_9EURY|nr:glycosyltransferase family 4 protein [Halovenus carboxidivorans]MXR50246.1 glycosyltransferase [Halovenus carboxidivorans]
MRVGLTLYGSLDERSGGFRYDRKLVEQLRRAGHTVETIELPWREYHRGLLDNASPTLRDRLAVDVDVMLQDELAHPSLVATNRRLPYPIVSIVHHLRASEGRALSGLYRAVERRYLDTVDGVVCNSTATRDVVTGLGVDAESTVVAPPAGDRFDPDLSGKTIAERAHSRPLQVVFVGNIAPRKGLDTLVEGLAAAGVDAELTVVGRTVDEAYVDEIRDYLADSDVGDRVHLVGELSDEQLAATLRESHVLAVPSRYEGFGIVYLEGMSFGLPAIASRAGGATDVVTDGETGVLVGPGDVTAVAGALTRLSDPERVAAMGQAARERYERHPGWEETTARVGRLLADVASVREVSA